MFSELHPRDNSRVFETSRNAITPQPLTRVTHLLTLVLSLLGRGTRDEGRGAKDEGDSSLLLPLSCSRRIATHSRYASAKRSLSPLALRTC